MGFINKTRKFRAGKTKEFMDDFVTKDNCSECGGRRLKKESLNFKINDTSISELNSMSIKEFSLWMKNAEGGLDSRQRLIAKPILKEIKQRVDLMVNLGLDYLSLDRPLRTLSGGEAQRIRLATQVGTKLVGVLYILDEPSIGLHQRDNNKLINSLKELRDLGNTVIVVEHDRDMIMQADFIVDLGPGAGINGGEIVSEGTYKKIIKNSSLTSQYLKNEKKIEIPTKRRTGNGSFIEIKGARGNNLKN